MFLYKIYIGLVAKLDGVLGEMTLMNNLDIIIHRSNILQDRIRVSTYLSTKDSYPLLTTYYLLTYVLTRLKRVEIL